MVFYFVVKFFLTALAASAEFPAGIVFPLLACGSVYGRLFGMGISQLFGCTHDYIYAAVGAASLVSSATHSVSISIIIFAVTGKIDYLIPMMISVFLAYGISSALTISFYDTMLELKQIHYLPLLHSFDMYSIKANKLLIPVCPYILNNSTIEELIYALQNTYSYMTSLPVINKKGILLFSVNINSAKSYIFEFYKEKIDNLDSQSQILLTLYLDPLLNFSPERPGRLIDQYDLKELIDESKEIKHFMRTIVDFANPCLRVDNSPFSIMIETEFVKIHFLFLMLNFSQLFVTKKGKLIGIITRASFLEYNSKL